MPRSGYHNPPRPLKINTMSAKIFKFVGVAPKMESSQFIWETPLDKSIEYKYKIGLDEYKGEQPSFHSTKIVKSHKKHENSNKV